MENPRFPAVFRTFRERISGAGSQSRVHQARAGGMDAPREDVPPRTGMKSPCRDGADALYYQ